MSDYEIFERIESTANPLSRANGYRYVVWEVGPMIGGETWFSTLDEARAFVAESVAGLPERQEPECDGSYSCPASSHTHGCFSDLPSRPRRPIKETSSEAERAGKAAE